MAPSNYRFSAGEFENGYSLRLSDVSVCFLRYALVVWMAATFTHIDLVQRAKIGCLRKAWPPAHQLPIEPAEP
ncbi:hypothetical protein XH94_04155 [Bradyrhizobium zhanjiangense]|uniref:Uncharacterized protein n=1 Tax=Bradyrhizobium zhanjiangense TaxID=1325107 RepID=A0A4Q0SVU7_9BRAD|nr:hypothetical protein XH94_04155 [Bradyrhizobium zhanjiangense]